MRKNKSMKLLALAMAVIMLAAVLTGCELIMGSKGYSEHFAGNS